MRVKNLFYSSKGKLSHLCVLKNVKFGNCPFFQESSFKILRKSEAIAEPKHELLKTM